MIQVLVADIDPKKVESIAASFNLGGDATNVTVLTSPLMAFRRILADRPDIFVCSVNFELAKNLSFKLLLESLSKEKAPILSLLMNPETNAGSVTSFNSLTNIPEVIDNNTAKSAVAFAASSKGNVEVKQNSAKLSVAVLNKQIATIMGDFADVLIPMIEETLVTSSAVRDKFYVKQTDEASGDISSIISVIAPGLAGCIAISFDEKLFLKIASNFMNASIVSLEDDGRDVITEIFSTCMVKVRKKLKGKDINIDNSLPLCFTGKGHKLSHLSSGKTICLKFKLGTSIVAIEYSVATKLA